MTKLSSQTACFQFTALAKAAVLTTPFMFMSVGFTQDMMQDQSFEQLIANIESLEVVSASKKLESLFEAPTAIGSISSQEIKRSGARNIPEALRLIPGLIVSEVSNGVYDVHIRGLDGAPVDRTQTYATTQNLLVLIDRQVFYDRNFGSIEWVGLPVALEEIDRIEVVRGANSALYGANAVTGVVHILTKNGADSLADGVHFRANLAAGPDRQNQYLSASANITESISSRFSVHGRDLDRYQESIYSISNNTYQDPSVPFATVPTGVPVDISQNLPFDGSDNAFGWNSSTRMELPAGHASFKMGRNLARSISIKNTSQTTPFTSTEAEFEFFNISALINGLDLQYDYLKADVDNFFAGTPTQFITFTRAFQAGYDMQLTDIFSTRLEYRLAAVSPSTNTSSNINNYAPGPYYEQSIMSRFDLNLDQLRIVFGLGLDKYDTPNISKVAFQTLATYQLENTLLRAGISRAHRSPYYEETLVSDVIQLNPVVSLNVEGNPDLPLLEAKQLEFGFRHLISKTSSVDVEFWAMEAEQFTTQTVSIIDPPPPPIAFNVRYQEIPTTVTQFGLTGQLLHQLNQATSLKAYLTLQKTDAENVFYDAGDLTAATDKAEHESTPTFYGGFVIDHQFNQQLGLNVNAYFMGSRLFRFDPYTEVGSGVAGVVPDEVPTVFALNSKLFYQLNSNLEIYAYGRNLLRDDKRQFLYSDDAAREISIGIDMKL